MADLRSPITLIGIGRSGTTLLEKAFDASSEVYACGETAGILFGTYAGALDSFFYSEKTDYLDRDEFASHVVRSLFQALFPIDNNKFWFHKPAGIPKMIPWERFRTAQDRYEFPTEWYWKVFDNVFPHAKYLTVLRNPWEIIRSRMIFSGWPEAGGWEDIKIMYNFLTERSEKIEFLFFDDLVKDPHQELLNLFERIGISAPENLTDVINTKYVPTPEKEEEKEEFSLEGPDYLKEDLDMIANLWRRFDKKFASPEGKINFFD